MRFQTLPEWLDWQESLHFTDIDPGLDRIGRVWQGLGGSAKLPFTVITVAGTNGKGSSVAMLESILRTAGYKTGTYTSPHVLRYNERMCIDNKPCSDESICQVFDLIDACREEVSLTYFEFATLAAVELFRDAKIDIAILEVGMGGRLDAINLFDTDVALITPISLDHTAWLGNTRELIGREKAGILRANKPVVCSEPSPPDSVLNYANALNSPIFLSGKEFDYNKHDDNWQWLGQDITLSQLSFPALEGEYQFQNATAVLQVIYLLIEQGYVVSEQAIKIGLQSVKLVGRFQRIAGDVEKILDVTHNEQGARNLAKLLTEIPATGHTFAVLGMLKDKDASAIASLLSHLIDKWFVGGLGGSRGMSSEQLTEQLLEHINAENIEQFDIVELAYKQALKSANSGDRILIFGSFHTVEAVLRISLN